NKPGIKNVLGLISLALLLVLAVIFLRAAWKTARRGPAIEAQGMSTTARGKGGYWLGFFFVLSSPWNIGFWLAVIGSQQSLLKTPSLLNSLGLASSVVLGAVTWTIVLSVAVTAGARVFTKPGWQVWTEILTAAVMLYFAVNLALRLFA
ncbi:MAG: LysE family transporter, partial [Verrucomicrobiota bacterium]